MGNQANSYTYDAFGNILNQTENVSNRFKYCGEQLDPLTNQYYLRARFYNPVIGRFTQEDDYRGDGLNLYTYVLNNPVSYVDPSGYVCEEKYNAYKEIREANPGITAKEAYEKLKEQKKLKESEDTAHLYRQMGIEEAENTIKENKLQHAVFKAEPTKWTSENLEKAFDFDNDKNKGIETIVVDFEIKKDYLEYLHDTAVKQRKSKKNPNNKWHQEGLSKKDENGNKVNMKDENGRPIKNFGIIDQNIEEFNENLISTKIINEYPNKGKK